MTKRQKLHLLDEIEEIGFLKAMENSYEKIKDQAFHELRQNFLEAFAELREYVQI